MQKINGIFTAKGKKMLQKLSKKLVTTLCGMASLNYIGYLIFEDTLDNVHKIELYALLITAQAALAGVHGLFQSKIDRLKSIKEEGKQNE